jgi:hypothetical protein
VIQLEGSDARAGRAWVIGAGGCMDGWTGDKDGYRSISGMPSSGFGTQPAMVIFTLRMRVRRTKASADGGGERGVYIYVYMMERR